MRSIKPPTGSRPPATPGAAAALEDTDTDVLAGATIVTHDLSGGTPAAGARLPGEPAGSAETGRSGLSGEWQRLRLYGGGLLMLLCFGLFGWQAWKGREPAAISVQPLAPGVAAEIKVHVTGAVAQPGVYRLAERINPHLSVLRTDPRASRHAA